MSTSEISIVLIGMSAICALFVIWTVLQNILRALHINNEIGAATNHKLDELLAKIGDANSALRFLSNRAFELSQRSVEKEKGPPEPDPLEQLSRAFEASRSEPSNQ